MQCFIRVFFFFSSRRRHTRSCLVSWARRCVQETALQECEPYELFTAEMNEIVDKTLESLPKQTKEIFIMSRYQNLSHKEIADKLNITTKGVEFHISKAIKALRISLKDYMPVLLFFLQ
eukprot:TRINITY_DN10482_c0_g1_i1.p2 TRINITY_DN10482_c0_g1~~TRINITY_DN10482_c0_g1_i1.p2  ORF type:complete len:119 (+),score=20.60 TRINITY_DN10482_c0_g1_i1:35-391(+)